MPHELPEQGHHREDQDAPGDDEEEEQPGLADGFPHPRRAIRGGRHRAIF